MTTVTQYYGITGPIEFLDVHVERDSPLFVDPRAIRLQPRRDPFAKSANRCTKTFFDEVAKCILASSSGAHARGRDLLQHFNEPRETRLGYAANGFNGHGGSDGVGADIWDSLSTDLEAFVRVSLLKFLEDVPLFVEGVDSDITSDLTTRIVFEPLADFTASMILKHPEFVAGTHKTGKFERQVWDPRGRRWTMIEVELPTPHDKPLLLVPRDWARGSLLMSARRFYDKSVLDFAQLENVIGRHPKTGRLILPGKDDLRRREAYARGRKTNVQVTQRAFDRDEDLVGVFRDFVDGRYEALDEDMIARKLQG